jgi:tetrapyrrole methylase family protein/MazG family protein
MTSLTLITTICSQLGLDPLAEGLQLLPADALLPPVPPSAAPGDGAWCEQHGAGPYAPPLVPFPLVATRPLLVCRLGGQAAPVAAALRTRYPPDHPVTLAAPGAPPCVITLAGLADAIGEPELCAYLPPLAPLDDLRGPDGPLAVVVRLLGPAGCPWDREQTHRTLRRELLEETYEALEAIDSGDMRALAEELGDVLLNVLMHSEMARQAGTFDIGDVRAGIAAKLIRRHPHIFGDTVVGGSGDVLRNWEAIKQAERAAKGEAPRGALDGIPAGLPALAAAQELARKAAKAGFDAPDMAAGWALLDEELAEVRAEAAAPSSDMARLEAELGDLLLAAARLAWQLGVDAESALRAAGARFRRRYAAMEQRLAAEGRALGAMSVPEIEAAWDAAKDD